MASPVSAAKSAAQPHASAKGLSSGAPPDFGSTVRNQQFDEEFVASDGDDESMDTLENDAGDTNPVAAAKPASPAPLEAQSKVGSAPAPRMSPPGAKGVGAMSPGGASASSGSASGSGSGSDAASDSGDDSDGGGDSTGPEAVAGAYNPKDYANLPVGAEVRDLFNYIGRYTPHEVELESTLRPFIPEYIPAVGEMDAFIKVPRPDSVLDGLGFKVLDEPSATQSDATVLELQLRAISKKQHGDVAVRSIENAHKNPGEVERWIKSMESLNKDKQPVSVSYSKTMPDIDALMQEWPSEFEALLNEVPLPSPKLEVDIVEYVKIICATLGIPVYENVAQSLHVLFELYTAFKESGHVQAMQTNVMTRDIHEQEYAAGNADVMQL